MRRPKTPFSAVGTRLRDSRVRQVLGLKERRLTGRGGSGRFRGHHHYGSGNSFSAEYDVPEDLGYRLVCTNKQAGRPAAVGSGRD